MSQLLTLWSGSFAAMSIGEQTTAVGQNPPVAGALQLEHSLLNFKTRVFGMKRILRSALPTIGFIVLSSISCSSYSDNGCQTPTAALLPTCLYLADSNLNHVYEDLMSVYWPLLDEHEKAALRNDEREWLKNRNNKCQLESGRFSSVEEWIHSFEKDVVKSECVWKMTNDRVVQLQNKKEEKIKVSEISKTRVSGKRDYVSPIIQKTGKTVIDFVPSGYLIFEKVENDFDGDALKDVAIVLRPALLGELDPRPLLILLAQKDGGYVLSARNDKIAPTGIGGGIANPNGADVLKTKDRSLLVQDFGGGSDSISGVIWDFRLLDNNWFLVGTEAWAMDRQGDAEQGICDRDVPGGISTGWKCTKHATQTDFRTGEVMDSWTLSSKTTDQVRIKKTKQEIERKVLKRFEDVTSDE